MDFSKLKLEIYDLLGLLLPGLISICEGWILLRGWPYFLASVPQLGATGFTLLLLIAFGLGHIVQELGDVAIKTVKGKRYFRQPRDRFWANAESQLVREVLRKELGQEIASVDLAFDYCLTKLKDRFVKRDVFLATSDLCRSFVLLSALGLLPAIRIAFHDIHPFSKSLLAFAMLAVLLLAIALLAWKRMVRFRELSETPVFHSYLATVGESQKSLAEPHP